MISVCTCWLCTNAYLSAKILKPAPWQNWPSSARQNYKTRQHQSFADPNHIKKNHWCVIKQGKSLGDPQEAGGLLSVSQHWTQGDIRGHCCFGGMLALHRFRKVVLMLWHIGICVHLMEIRRVKVQRDGRSNPFYLTAICCCDSAKLKSLKQTTNSE